MKSLPMTSTTFLLRKIGSPRHLARGVRTKLSWALLLFAFTLTASEFAPRTIELVAPETPAHDGGGLSLWKSSRGVIEADSIVPMWLTLTAIGALITLVLVNTVMSASEASMIGALRRLWRGPHLDHLYLPLVCQLPNTLFGERHEHLLSIDERHAMVLARTPMARGTRLSMRLEREKLTADGTAHDLKSAKLDEETLATFAGTVTKCTPLPGDATSFLVRIRIDQPGNGNPQTPLREFLTATSRTQQTSAAG